MRVLGQCLLTNGSSARYRIPVLAPEYNARLTPTTIRVQLPECRDVAAPDCPSYDLCCEHCYRQPGGSACVGPLQPNLISGENRSGYYRNEEDEDDDDVSCSGSPAD